MRDSDLIGFSDMLSDVASLYGKTISTTQASMWFRAMSNFSIEQVQAAFDAHTKNSTRGRFMPTPADLIGEIEESCTNDGRPTPAEAWSIALQADDERNTVVWTKECAAAWWQVGSGLMQAKDRFNASKGFIETYAKMVRDARGRGEKAVWEVTVGTDVVLRQRALETAYRKNQLTMDVIQLHLPGQLPKAGKVLALIHEKVIPLLEHLPDGGDKSEVPTDLPQKQIRLSSLISSKREEVRDSRPSVEHGLRIVNACIEAQLIRSVAELEKYMAMAHAREPLNELQAQLMSKELRHG